ncbi:hypothetical protein EDB87DRAFT_1574179 [Lactarius vividus]|nr:hypothetical protein EDB87DRAFT_1574179 [Lactarius vividus]
MLTCCPVDSGCSELLSMYAGMGFLSDEFRLPFASPSVPPAASPLHLPLYGLEDPPTPDEIRHGRPVERVVNTAINYLTIRCHTRNLPPRDRVLVRRLKEVLSFVKGLGREVAIIENDEYCKYLNNQRHRSRLVPSRGRKVMTNLPLSGTVIYTRAIVPPVLHPATEDIISQPSPKSHDETEDTVKRGNSYPSVIHDAPLLSTNEYRIFILADVFETGPRTPTPHTPPLRLGMHSCLTPPSSDARATLRSRTGTQS